MRDSSFPVLHGRDDGDGHSVGNQGRGSHSEKRFIQNDVTNEGRIREDIVKVNMSGEEVEE